MIFCSRFLFLFVISVSVAYAEQCESYIGNKPALISFEQVIKIFEKFTPKTEFETTAEFTARRKNVIDSLGNDDLIIVKNIPESDRKFIEYDADNKQFKIIKYAFNNYSVFMEGIFKAVNYKMPGYSSGRVVTDSIVVNRRDKVIDEYKATNAHGASVLVTKLQRQSHVIFDGGELFSQAQSSNSYSLGFIKIEPEAAKKFKESVRVAFVVKTKEPYFFSGSHISSTAKFNNPFDINEDFYVLFASVNCGLIIDESGVAVGAFKANR